MAGSVAEELRFVWLEITGRCQLACEHCYAGSGPTGTHGRMTTEDWLRVVDEAAGLGVPMVQFIGGEPTLHPDLPVFVERALAHGVEVEVFTNLDHVTSAFWELFARPGVRLATSWYSDDADEHEAVTTRRGSHRRTLAGITEAVRRGIPLRAGIIGVRDRQRVEPARQLLAVLGVTEVAYDDLRQVGRGIRDQEPGMDQLCGKCAAGVLAVAPSGEVWPCVFARWLPVGNVLDQSLRDVLLGAKLNGTREQLRRSFSRRSAGDCHPDCKPAPCDPSCPPRCSPACNPCQPGKRCWPSYR
jgi:MoaA/NifB/PqqE/SkfB family radical SAM enzyme